MKRRLRLPARYRRGAFRLAEAFVELFARTKQADAAIDTSVNKVKTFGIESERAAKLSQAAFLKTTLGVTSLTAVVVGVASGFRSLVAAINESVRSGEGFGAGVLKWIEGLTGVESQITRTKRLLAEDVRLGKVIGQTDIIAGRGVPGAIPGLPSEQSNAFQQQRSALMGESIKNMDRLSSIKGAIEGGGLGPEEFTAKAQELAAAVQEKQRIDIAMRRLEETIDQEVEKRKDSIRVQEEASKADKQFGDQLISFINPAILELGRNIGAASKVMAVAAGMAPAADVNGLPEEMADVFEGFASITPSKGKARIASQMMGAQEFSRAMLTGTAGESELEKKAKEQLEVTKKMDENLKKIEENTAKGNFGVFAPGEGLQA